MNKKWLDVVSLNDVANGAIIKDVTTNICFKLVQNWINGQAKVIILASLILEPTTEPEMLSCETKVQVLNPYFKDDK